ncbi:MAG: DUF2268 domain-containing putative Zn-dependent protease [Bacteroidota bacterium]
MHDKLSGGNSREDSLAILREHYLDKASKGLKKYFEVEKTENGRDMEAIEHAYLNVLASYPKYLSSIREATLNINNMRPKILNTFLRLKEVYPDFKFPDAYFCMGFMNMGARSFIGSEMYIGVEFFATSKNANYEEVGNDNWLESNVVPVESTYQVLAHEYTHGQQKLPPRGSNSLLTLTLLEGSAVFTASLVTNGESLIGGAGVNKRAFSYGETYEEEIWEKFKKDMKEGNDSNWFYNAETEDFPKDMGYYVGYKICPAYYQNAVDKKQAIQEIVELNNYDTFIEVSKYEDKFR